MTFVTAITAYINKALDFLHSIPPIDYLLTLLEKISDDYIGLVAAGIAFYFLLASFPAIAGLISLYGLMANPYEITEQFQYFERFLPEQAYDILIMQAEK